MIQFFETRVCLQNPQWSVLLLHNIRFNEASSGLKLQVQQLAYSSLIWFLGLVYFLECLVVSSLSFLAVKEVS